MKKLYYLLACIFFVSNINSLQAQEQCFQGKPINGVNGHTYCMSKIPTNWWSAFSWCEMQGRHLVSLHEACDIDPQHTYTKEKCLNLIGKLPEKIWTSTPSPNKKGYAFYVYQESGGIYDDKKVHDYQPERALCW